MVTAPMITPSVLPPLLGIMTTVNAYHTMLIIDKTRAAVQAHRRPFSSPEATINETIAERNKCCSKCNAESRRGSLFS